jgi:hypothetical protein
MYTTLIPQESTQRERLLMALDWWLWKNEWFMVFWSVHLRVHCQYVRPRFEMINYDSDHKNGWWEW